MLNFIFIIFCMIMGGIGGSLLFNFSYQPANFNIGSAIGGIIAVLYIIIKKQYYLKD